MSMGYAHLYPTDMQEGRLINLIMNWEIQHPEQRALIDGRQTEPSKMRKGAESMLDMRVYLVDNMRQE